MLLVCVVPLVVCGTLPLLALLIIRHMYTTSTRITTTSTRITTTSTRSTAIYIVASEFSGTGPVVEEQLGSTDDNVVVDDVNTLLHVHVPLLFAVYSELGFADWYSGFVG